MADRPITVKEVPEMQVVGVRKPVAMKDIVTLFVEAGRKLRSRPAGSPFAVYHDPEFDPAAVDVVVLFPVPTRGPENAARGQT